MGMIRSATSLHLTTDEMLALGDLARQRGIYQPRGAGKRLRLGNTSELVRQLAAGKLCLYDPATEVAISREEYARLMDSPN